MTPHSQPMPIGRFEWERLVRRIRMPGPHKYLALVLSTYADPDGTRVRPGNEVLADVTGYSKRHVIRILNTLRDLQLLQQVSRGGGRGNHGKATTYRLTIPTDLIDRAELLTPNGRAEHHPPDPHDTQMSPQSAVSAVDNGQTTVDKTELQPVDNAQTDPIEVTSNTVTKPIEVTSEPIEVTSGCRTTTHIHQPQKTKPVVTTQRNSRPRARAREPPPHRRQSPIHESRKDAA